MNTYVKFCPNVFLARCPEPHDQGDEITVTTKYGKENLCIVFNLVKIKDGFYFYSIVRSDGFNVQEWAKRKSERHMNAARNASKKSNESWEASNKDSAFLSLGEPIKIGHHSEKRHRKVIESAQRNMDKAVEFSNKAESYAHRAEYWEAKADTINESMPESLEYFEFLLEEAEAKHKAIKEGAVPSLHSYSLSYAKKKVNTLRKKLEIARVLWS